MDQLVESEALVVFYSPPDAARLPRMDDAPRGVKALAGNLEVIRVGLKPIPSQGEFERAIGYSKGTISKWKQGKKGLPDAGRLIAAALHEWVRRPIDALLLGVDADYDALLAASVSYPVNPPRSDARTAELPEVAAEERISMVDKARWQKALMKLADSVDEADAEPLYNALSGALGDRRRLHQGTTAEEGG